MFLTQCSFCCDEPPKEHLIIGPEVSICSSCVGFAQSHLGKHMERTLTCMFRPHKWVFIGNVVSEVGVNVQREVQAHRYGLYQCSRCKELSKGSPDGPHGKRGIDAGR